MGMLKIISADAPVVHMIRIFNTNISGRLQLIPALRTIRGIGMRFAQCIIKKANLNPSTRAGELTEEEQEKIAEIMRNPTDFGIPEWFLNHQKDHTTGKTSHLIGNEIDTNLRFTIERGKKMGHMRYLRLARGTKVRGQRTKSNGRRGKVVGVSR